MPYPEKLRKSLQEHKIGSAIMQQIYAGFEEINDKSSQKVKVPFMRRAMNILDEQLDNDTKYEVIDQCACSLTGSREKNVKRFVKSLDGQNLELAEKVRLLREANPFYNSTRLNDDGTITDGIYYQADGEYKCACPCLNKEQLEEPISSTYCLCCAGHYRHFIQLALGVTLKTSKVASSPLESLGKEPCEFIFEVLS